MEVLPVPYSKKAKYKHMRQLPPKRFVKKSFRNVKPSHAPEKRIKEKKYPRGTRVVVGKLKTPVKGRSGRKRHYATQTILIPKRRH